MDKSGGQANEIMQYSFLVVFANDRTIDAGELAFLKRLALADSVVDEGEKKMLRAIFGRVTQDMVAPPVWAEMETFRRRHAF